MVDLSSITPDATLATLPLFHEAVDADTLGQAIAQQFERRPELPGFLVTEQGILMGLVSRRRFHEQISSPYGLEVFFSRPIRVFLDISRRKGRADFLTLPDTEKIDAAVRIGLGRNPDSVYEPIVVTAADHDGYTLHHLLDFQTLLLAQSHLLALSNGQMETQWQQTRHYMLKLNEERQRVQTSMALLQEQQQVIQDRNQTLEAQQVELVRKNEEIAHLNQKFVQISQLLSMDGRNAFEATFMGVDGICHSTTEIVEVGRALQADLKTVQDAATMVGRVSYQVRHLATKAAIVANHAGKELSGFSHITDEISKLVGQTYEASQQLDRVAHHFRDRIQAFTDAARSSTNIARSLLIEINRAEEAIAALESLLKQSEGMVEPLEPSADLAPNDVQTLMQVLNQAEALLNRLDRGGEEVPMAQRMHSLRQRWGQTGEISDSE
ncbi:MAG: hypothetical protein O3C67_01250 [Cyanobacteria bacterium]|nr:hypothetical protein [Cyanobacteriota bacterium]